jgi:hypothetical protein
MTGERKKERERKFKKRKPALIFEYLAARRRLDDQREVTQPVSKPTCVWRADFSRLLKNSTIGHCEERLRDEAIYNLLILCKVRLLP